MDGLEYMTDRDITDEIFASLASPSKFFPSLVTLKLYYGPNLKGWWRTDIVDNGNVAMTTSTSSSNHHQQHIPLPSFPRLSYFRLWGCPKMTCMPLFPNLEEGLELTRTSFKPLQQTIAMTMNTTGGTSSFLSSSSSSFFSPPLSKLKQLRLWMMQDLESLPVEWSKNLTSLEELEILGCPNLMSLPERWVTSPFYTFWKSSNVPHLEQRWHKEIEEDWTNISHIPKLSISWKGCLIWEKFNYGIRFPGFVLQCVISWFFFFL